jgi:hypothetical protein
MISLKIYCVTNKCLKVLENSNLNLVGVGSEEGPDNYIIPDKLDKRILKKKIIPN